MADVVTLLETKLNPPPALPALVMRPRLITLLNGAHPLTLISAPPGFGKTTLLTEWLAKQDHTAVAWLSLDAGDNDPIQFLAYLAAALDRASPGTGKTSQALVTSPELVDQRIIVTLLINALNSTSRDVLLVLDDYHVIHSQAVHDVVNLLLNHRPPRLRLCIMTRADPPLTLSRLRARGALLEIRASHLRFTRDEAAQFLEQVMGVRLPMHSLEVLNARTEGWIAGLQLAALSMRGRHDVTGFLSAFAGSNTYVVDYLVDEVLAQQPDHIENFLLQTAILDQFSGALCDAVTGRSDSSSILEALERANVFVIPLDAERRWYRYHHLFRDVLTQRLHNSNIDVTALFRRASDWYERHDKLDEAVHFALSAGDVERAAALIEASGTTVGQTGRIQQALGWFNTLPEALVLSRPDLCIVHAGLLTHVSQPDAAEARMQDAEHWLQSQPDTPIERVNIMRGRIAAIRSELARSKSDFVRCFALARQALALLPASEVVTRERLSSYLLLDFVLTGNVTLEAERRQTEWVASARQSGNLVGQVNGFTTLGWMQLFRGELRKAAMTFEQAIAGWDAMRLENLGMIIYCRLGLADILREWGRWEEAEAQMAQGLAVIHASLTPDANLVSRVAQSLTRLKQAQGDNNGVHKLLDDLSDLAKTHQLGALLDARLMALKAWQAMVEGDIAAAGEWAASSGLHAEGDLTVHFQRELEHLILTRIWIAQGRVGQTTKSAALACRLLDRMSPVVEAGNRTKSLIEIRVLRALALRVLGDVHGAITTLYRALALAEPEGYLRVFIDEGAPMRDLLQQLKIQDLRLREYSKRLLTAFADSKVQPALHEPSTNANLSQIALVEPLSERELEVLRLVADGMSDRQIAERLIVAIGTVKRHLNNLYGKLGVHSRTAALARARELGLL